MRTIRDANLIKSVNLPAAGASAVTPAIKLGTGPHTEILEGRINVPATPSLADAKTITVILEESDSEDSGFAEVPAVAGFILTGAGGDGADAYELNFRFPPDIKMFVRAKATVLAAGGDNSDQELTLSVVV